MHAEIRLHKQSHIVLNILYVKTCIEENEYGQGYELKIYFFLPHNCHSLVSISGKLKRLEEIERKVKFAVRRDFYINLDLDLWREDVTGSFDFDYSFKNY